MLIFEKNQRNLTLDFYKHFALKIYYIIIKSLLFREKVKLNFIIIQNGDSDSFFTLKIHLFKVSMQQNNDIIFYLKFYTNID